MRILALDVGDKTIGVAVSDPLNMFAQGVTTIERIGIKKDTSKVIDYLKEYDCDTLVIGLPTNLMGEDTIQTEKVREFRKKIENKLMSTGLNNIKVKWHDERFTTSIAENILIQADVSRSKRKNVIDKQAAVIILQSYMDTVGNKKSE